MKNIVITTADGYQLSALFATPVSKAVRTIVVSAATGIKKEYYINFANYLVQNGFNVLMFDYRGIGGSAPDDLKLLKSPMHEWGTKDMEAALDYLVVERNLKDIIWIGHSAGAQLIGFTRSHRYIKKVISINSVFGYYNDLPSPKKLLVWFLWKFAAPLMIKTRGYGTMRMIGWGEDLPPNMLMQWRSWCLSKTYFRRTIMDLLGTDKFYDIRMPIHTIRISDDDLANDKTVSKMIDFFPNAVHELHEINVKDFTSEKVGHVGFFRKKFENSLWPYMVRLIEKEELIRKTNQSIELPKPEHQLSH